MNVRSVKGRGLGCASVTLSALIFVAPAFAGDSHALLPPLKTVSVIASTVPGNGDVNPYGMAQVKRTTGNLRAGHILISNFNNNSNLQGTGTTIVDVAPDGRRPAQRSWLNRNAGRCGRCRAGNGADKRGQSGRRPSRATIWPSGPPLDAATRGANAAPGRRRLSPSGTAWAIARAAASTSGSRSYPRPSARATSQPCTT